MEEDEAYLEHIESDEIKKLIERIYNQKSESNVLNVDTNPAYDEIVKQIDEIPLKSPKKRQGLND